MRAKHVVWILYGFGFLMGSCAFSGLFGKHWDTFIALGIVSAMVFGSAWLCRRFLLPRKGEDHVETIALVFMVAFGGGGLAMLAGSVAQFVDGEIPGGIGLGVFGSMFAGVGTLARYVLRRRRRRIKAG